MSVEPINMFELDMPAVSRASRLREKLERNIRAQFTNYLRVFAGTGVRLGLQAVYFFILANTLSLRDMGLFASTSATGIMIGCFSGLGFSSFAFRAAAGKRRALGGHLAVFYVSWLISLPLCLAASLPVFYLLFTTSLSLTAFLLIILVEAGTWRIVEMIHQVNNGLGRYGSASLVISLGTALRTAGAVAFMASGKHDVETWSTVYVIFNLAALARFAVFRAASRSPDVRDRLLRLHLAERDRQGGDAVAGRPANRRHLCDRLAAHRFHVGADPYLLCAVFAQADPRRPHAQQDRPQPQRRDHDRADLDRRVRGAARGAMDLAASSGPQRRVRRTVADRGAGGAGLQEPAGISLRAVLRLSADDDPCRARDLASGAEGRGAGAAADFIRQHHAMGRLAQRNLYRPLRALGHHRLQFRTRE